MSENNNQNKAIKSGGFVMQAGILAVAGIIVRIIGLLYRSPLNAIIGDLGAGYYSTAYSVYTIILLISSYSIPSAIAKVIAQKLAFGQHKNAQRLFHGALIYVVVVGGIASLITYFCAPFLAEGYASDVLKVFAPTIFLSGILGVLRGYFQARRTMVSTSVSQILEQLLNAVVSIGGAYLLMKLATAGTTKQAVFGAMGSAIGTGAGVLIALIYMYIVYLRSRNKERRLLRKDTSEVDSYKNIFRTIFCIVTPFLLSTFIYNCSTVTNMTIYEKIMINLNAVSEERAITDYGIFAYKAVTVANIPIAMASAMSAAMIPSISAAFVKGEIKQTRRKIHTAIHTTMLIAIPSAVGLFVLAKPVMRCLFWQKESLDMASSLLMVLAVTVIFYSLSTITNAVLQGIGKVNIPVINALIALGLQVAVLMELLLLTDINLYALAIAMITYSLTMCILNGMAVRKYLHYHHRVMKTFIKPFIAAVIMGVFAWGTYYGLYYLVKRNILCVAIAIIVAAIVYFICVFKLGVLTENELLKMPKGKKLVRVAKRIHLL